MMHWPGVTVLETLVTEESLSRRQRENDIEAIAELMEQFQHRLYRYLLRIVQQPGTAEDLFQQTWIRVMEQIRHYDPRRSFAGWLFAIAHNLAIDHLRRRKPESLDDPSPWGATESERLPDESPGALDRMLSRERADQVLEALAGLPMAYREVITLRFEEELKLEEIAVVLSLPMGTVKTRLHRGLKLMRQMVTQKAGSKL
jgi:RNA polymerase sigma-70 factor, ECF subfamily